MKFVVASLLALLLLLLVGVMLAPMGLVSAKPNSAVWFVAPNGSDGNSCQSPTAPCATINGAIGKVAPDDTINAATGIYTDTGTEVVLLNKTITLSGG